MKKIVLVLSVIAVAILAITLAVPSEHSKRMAKINELQWESLDTDTAKYATTQRDIDSLLKRVDKEYAITSDHDIRMDLIDERRELEQANSFNLSKSVIIKIDRIQKELASIDDTIISRVDLHRDPGQKAKSAINKYTQDNERYLDLHRDPGRKA